MKRTILALTLLALLLGCGTSAEIVPTASPDTLYKNAITAMDKESWETAKANLDRLKEDYPFSPYAVEAELLAADMLYRQELYEAAVTSYGAFQEFHPFHEKAPYALYMRGVSYFQLIDSEDRDVSVAVEAVKTLDQFLKQNPNHPKAKDAGEKFDAAVNVLAAHELYVAKYYDRYGRPEAALIRLKGLLRDYPDSKSRDEALKLALELEGDLAKQKAKNK